MSDEVYVIERQMGICRVCGQECDLRYGHCRECATPEVVAQVKADIGRAKTVAVVVRPGDSRR